MPAFIPDAEATRLRNIREGIGCPHGRRALNAPGLKDCAKCDEFEADLMAEGRYFDEGGIPEGGEFVDG